MTEKKQTKKYIFMGLIGVIILSLTFCTGKTIISFDEFKPMCESSVLLTDVLFFNRASNKDRTKICECIYNTHKKENDDIVTQLYADNYNIINAMLMDGKISNTLVVQEKNIQIKCSEIVK